MLEERGDVYVKGKGLMHTWYLVGRRNVDSAHDADAVAQGALN